MVEYQPVNLKHQTIFAIIPGVNFYAFYRIQKLRMLLLTYLGIYIGISVIVPVVALGLLFVSFEEKSSIAIDFIQSLGTIVGHVILLSIVSLVNVYLIRRWSEKWNQKLNSHADEPPTHAKFY